MQTGSARAATSGLCVMMTMVFPVSRSRSKVRITTSPVLESRFPVVSSPKMIGGLRTNALAMATRCICPPESSLVFLSKSIGFKSTERNACTARSSRWRTGQSEYASGSITLRRTLVRGSRLKDWNTKPINVPRSSERSSSFRSLTSIPHKRYVPEDGRSRSPSVFMSVDLPEPLGPMMAKSSPSRTLRETPLST